MSGNFNLADYVDVAERIREFSARYPDGSLQAHMQFVDGGVLCTAKAYRTADDPRPGMGHAFEPIPGKTPYTRDSEVQNAETSAWGRAIVALGFDTKKIASKQEVEARTGAGVESPSPPSAPARDGASPAVDVPSPNPGGDAVAPGDSFPIPEKVQDALGLQESRADNVQQPRNKEAAGRVRKEFGKKHAGLTVAEIDEKDKSHLDWIAGSEFEPKGEKQIHFKQAVCAYLGLPVPGAPDPDSDIPFAYLEPVERGVYRDPWRP